MLRIKRLLPNATVHAPAYAGDAGYDLASVTDLVIQPGEWQAVPTGIALALPAGTVGLIHPRSGLAAKHGITVLNAPGTIDSGYRGHVKVLLINHGREAYFIEAGERIAQLLIQQFETPVIALVDDFGDTDRGSAGFGSSGTT